MKKYILNDNNDLTFETREKADQHAMNQGLKKYTVSDGNNIWEYEITDSKHKYRITSMQASSEKYGKCRICGEHASEMFLQSESKYYNFEHDGEIYEGWTCHECHDLFGHKECLLSMRR